MNRCPQCETELPSPTPAICPSCGESLGAPPRRAVEAGAPKDARVAPAALAATPAQPVEQVLFEGRPAAVATFGDVLLVVLTLGLGWVWLWARAVGSSYRLTTTRIVMERGLFSKRLEQIDLYRVEDYVVELPLGQRMLGTGNLVITTTDRTSHGEVRLDRLRTDVRKLYEDLRAATEADKLRRGVRRVDAV